MKNNQIKIGGQFSGVGAFDEALNRLGIDYLNVYQAEWDKHARKTYLANHTEPVYYVEDVHDTPTQEITEKYGSLDIAMFSPPCQAFSLAGKRKGEDDDRGILFYKSHEFIQKNKPRFFIFENVKGLISDSNGTTFQRWIAFLGGKSVNGNPTIFPMEESVPYHVYWQVLNAKDYGIPQNRERIFIVGIRDDEDNHFSFPKEIPLTKRLKDVLEENVDEKYYLSEKMINGFINHSEKHKERGTGFQWKPKDVTDIANCIAARGSALGVTDNSIKVGYINQDTQASQVFSTEGNAPNICAGTHGYANGYIQVKSATSKGYEIAEAGEDSINFEHQDSKTRRGRVGKKVAQTLTTSCNQGVAEVNVVANLPGKHEQNGRVYDTLGISPTLCAGNNGGGQSPVKHITNDYRIRKLTPIEAFRLMDFPDTLAENARKVGISDSQLYRQAGNSICVGVLAAIIKQLKYLVK